MRYAPPIVVLALACAPAQVEAQTMIGNGQTDLTGLFQALVNATPSGGAIVLPAGHFRLTGTISITKPITIVGAGLGTQLSEQADATMFRLTNVNGAVLSNMYLGSTATSAGTSLIELVNSNHNRIDNITMLGGNYGLHLKGALLNTIIDLRSGTNFQGFFAPTSITQTWVFAEAFNAISANANTFVAPVLEGGANGIVLNDGNGQGNMTITGGTIEGVSGTGVTFNTAFGPTSITGTHFEANGVADVTVNSSSNITLNTIFSLSPITLNNDTRNILISGGIIEHLTIGPNTKRIRVENVTTGITTACPNNIVNNNPNGTSSYDGSPSVVLSQIGIYCYGN